jgi:hypothetical protein
LQPLKRCACCDALALTACVLPLPSRPRSSRGGALLQHCAAAAETASRARAAYPNVPPRHVDDGTG